MKLVLACLLFLGSLTASDITHVHEISIEAHDLYEKGLYGSALIRYNQICFEMCPEIQEVEQVFQEMSIEQKKIFLEAWHGRLTSLSHLGKVSPDHIRERKILDKLDESTIRAVDEGDYTILENMDGLNEEEVDQFTEELIAKNLIESKNHVSYENGKVRLKIKQEDPCCNDCAESVKKGRATTKAQIPKL